MNKGLREIIKGLDNHSLDGLIKQVEQTKGKRVKLVPYDIPEPTFWAAVIEAPNAYYIFYEQRTPLVHREHNICHELAHILLGHNIIKIDQLDDLVAALKMALRRDRTFDRRNLKVEKEAESMAGQMQRMLFEARQLTLLTTGTATTPEWEQFARSLAINDGGSNAVG